MNLGSARKGSGRKGFTLMEVMISLCLLVLGATAGFDVFKSLSRRYKKILSEIPDMSRQDTALSWMARDFRSALVYPESRHTFFVGRPDQVIFFQREETEREIHYLVQDNALHRRTQGGDRIFFKDQAAGLRFRYHDGDQWKEEWGWDGEGGRPLDGLRGLPHMVQIQMNGGETVFPVMVPLLNRGP